MVWVGRVRPRRVASGRNKHPALDLHVPPTGGREGYSHATLQWIARLTPLIGGEQYQTWTLAKPLSKLGPLPPEASLASNESRALTALSRPTFGSLSTASQTITQQQKTKKLRLNRTGRRAQCV